MKIAVAVWKNRISPLLDSASMLLIARIEDGMIASSHYENVHSEILSSKAIRIYTMGVKVVICGAVSHFLENMIEAYGIRVIPFVAGDVNQVIDAYLKGNLSAAKFQMPGCGFKRRRFSANGSWKKI
ncbi:MAG: NifB/NifX family molybdenum-iron cluster-binding protein [Thermodesulfobacteriota bacterium]|nr:NifB/NifX family molybdenum-iron cluster-binding protein [Thermodesulfobacteriota bacterium]